jgi:hypothetical protein
MKKILLIFLLALQGSLVIGCPVCDKQQPAVLRGITHGTGPESRWDYLIVWIAVILVLLTLFYSLKWLIKPGEKSHNHIKQAILN